jgi:hypothetical protein
LSKQAPFNRLSRLRNHNLPCDRCNRPIEALAAHLDARGKAICRFMPMYDRYLEEAEREATVTLESLLERLSR